MLATLLTASALAGPPQVAVAVGPVLGGGTSTHGDYFSAAPAGALTVTWHLGPIESFVGGSGSLLMAGYGDRVIPASLLQGEVGVGLGTRGAGGGFYVGAGFPGPIVGLYGRATVPGAGWMERIGLETRLFHTAVTDSTGLALLFRVEPGIDDRGRRHGRRTAQRPPPAPPPPYPEAPAEGAGSAAAPPPEEPSVVIPAGVASPPEEPEEERPSHHDDPY